MHKPRRHKRLGIKGTYNRLRFIIGHYQIASFLDHLSVWMPKPLISAFLVRLQIIDDQQDIFKPQEMT